MSGDESTRILNEGTERTTGRTALRNNVAAAVALAEAVQSTLGPGGMDKMLVNNDGDAVVTNDGVTVLKEAKIEHPTAKTLAAVAHTQDEIARDGTTSSVALSSELLQVSLELVERGLHPATIVGGLESAMQTCKQALREKAIHANQQSIVAAVETSLAGKVGAEARRILSSIALEASTLLRVEEDGVVKADPSSIKTIGVKGGLMEDSHLVHGLVLAKKRVEDEMDAEITGGRVLLLDGSLERRETTLNAKYKVESPSMLETIRKREEEMVRKEVDAVLVHSPNVIICREGIDEYARRFLKDAGVTAYRRMERVDMELVSRTTGAQFVQNAKSMSGEEVGNFSRLREEKWNGTTHMILEGVEQGGATLVVKGASDHALAEAERAFADALGIACGLQEDPSLLPGGGGWQVSLARHLREVASQKPNREQLVFEAYASALEELMRTLVYNIGMDPIDELLKLRAIQSQDGDRMGLNLMTKEVEDMVTAGILDTLKVVSQIIAGATEAAISVLRIDDLIWAKTDPTTPNLGDSEADISLE